MSKSQLVTVFILVLVIIIIVLLWIFLPAKNFDNSAAVNSNQTNTNTTVGANKEGNAIKPDTNNQLIQNPMELQIETLTPGQGEPIVAGQTAVVHYTGWLTDGTKFDSSVDRGTPFEFVVGAGAVIAGWDQGVIGMKVGEKRKLTIPSDLAYGDAGVGPIPPKATLVFEVELLTIK